MSYFSKESRTTSAVQRRLCALTGGTDARSKAREWLLSDDSSDASSDSEDDGRTLRRAAAAGKT